MGDLLHLSKYMSKYREFQPLNRHFFLSQSLVKTLILVLSDQNWLTEIVKGAKNWLMLPQCKKNSKKGGAFMFFAGVMLPTVCGYLSQTVS